MCTSRVPSICASLTSMESPVGQRSRRSIDVSALTKRIRSNGKRSKYGTEWWVEMVRAVFSSQPENFEQVQHCDRFSIAWWHTSLVHHAVSKEQHGEFEVIATRNGYHLSRSEQKFHRNSISGTLWQAPSLTNSIALRDSQASFSLCPEKKKRNGIL